jgi:hypothetical protein
MAPEAYSLHAAIKQWIAGADDNQVRKAAASSYNKWRICFTWKVGDAYDVEIADKIITTILP